jgi:SAM-dependent methyltransferase
MTTAAFDSLAQRYDAYNAVRDRLAPATPRWLAEHITSGRRAVDLGCGPGRFTPLLSDHHQQVLAVDLSEAMVRHAQQHRARPNITYEHRSLLDVTPEDDGTFDTVLTVNTLHHAGPLDTVLQHVRGLLSPGGQLLLVDIVDPGGWGDRQWHIDQAFKAARHFYDQGGEDTDASADVVRLLAHPQWLDMTVTDKPPSREDYRRTAGQVFPDATFNDDLHPLGIQTALMWRASS